MRLTVPSTSGRMSAYTFRSMFRSNLMRLAVLASLGTLALTRSVLAQTPPAPTDPPAPSECALAVPAPRLRTPKDIIQTCRQLDEGASAGEIRKALCESPDVVKQAQRVGGEALATCLLTYGKALRVAGHYAQAHQRFVEAATEAQKARATSKTLPVILVNQGFLEGILGNLADGKAHIAQALAMVDKGPDTAEKAAVLLRAGEFSQESADYPRAVELLEKAAAIHRQVHGEKSLELATTLTALGGAYLGVGESDRAQRHLLYGLEIRVERLGENNPILAYSFAALGNFNWATGRYTLAKERYFSALRVGLPAVGEEHPEVAMLRRRLAETFLKLGEVGSAVVLLEQALGPAGRAFGDESAQIALLLTTYATALLQGGRIDDAAAHAARAYEIHLRVFKDDPRNRFQSIFVLGQIRMAQKKYAEAEKLFREGLAAAGAHEAEAPFESGLLMLELAKARLALNPADDVEELETRGIALVEARVGKNHPALVDGLTNLALASFRRGQFDRALSLQNRVEEILEQNLAQFVVSGSELQKRAYLESLRFSTSATVSMLVATPQTDRGAVRLAFLASARRKGRVLNVMIGTNDALRQRSRPEVEHIFTDLIHARRELSSLDRERSTPSVGLNGVARRSRIEAEVNALEARLSTLAAVTASPVSVEQIQAALPVDAILLEYATYVRLPLRSGESTVSRHYVVYGARRGGSIVWADLGDANVIDDLAVQWRSALLRGAEAEAQPLGDLLYERIVRPTEPWLQGISRVFLSTDGQLSVVPFAALRDQDGNELLRRFSFTYLTSAHDVTRWQIGHSARQPPLIVAGPDFDRAPASSDPAGPFPTDVANRPHFSRLAGAESEGRQIASLWAGSRLLVSSAATESALQGVQGPEVLHFATHGFYELPGPDEQEAAAGAAGGPPSQVLIDNPLLRSGLAMAGANVRGGDEDDGILTALEVASMDLFGTKVVVASACDSGLGEITQGEGVLGLRRAFLMAGAESQVMSLWRVDDAATRRLMVDYYRALAGGAGRSEALRQAQVTMLSSDDFRSPRYWAPFVASGDYRRLDGSEPPAVVAHLRVSQDVHHCGCTLPGREGTHDGPALVLVCLLAVTSALRRSPTRARRSV